MRRLKDELAAGRGERAFKGVRRTCAKFKVREVSMEEGRPDVTGPQEPGPWPGVLGSSGRGGISSECGKSLWGLCEDEEEFEKPQERLGWEEA